MDLAVPIAGLLGVWWLALREGEVGVPAGWRTPLVALGLGGALALLLHRPGDWALMVNTVAPGHPALALVAGGAALWVVVGLWLVVAAALLQIEWGRA